MTIHWSTGHEMDVDQSPFMSPPGSRSPSKGGPGTARLRHKASGGSSLDATGLTQALENLSRTPRSTSPQRRRPRVLADRFIPTRSTDRLAAFSLLDQPDAAAPSKHHSGLQSQKQELANQTYTDLLRAEMFDSPAPSRPLSTRQSRTNTPSKQSSTMPVMRTPPSNSRNLFSFVSNFDSGQASGSKGHSDRALFLNPQSDIYSLSPLKKNSQQILSSPVRPTRTVPKVPFKVLDAPELADDFYLNLIDWGKSNLLAVGLGQMVYTWNSATGEVKLLKHLPQETVTSVNWADEGTVLAVGTGTGRVHLYDVTAEKLLRTVHDHEGRTGAIAWNSFVLTTGGRDRSIFHRDVRQPDGPFLRLTGHKQEVCGLKWNTADNQLASGGNDNKLLVWDRLGCDPLYQFSDHKAAVKGIAWSPHRRGLLASGGGTADRTIKFWDTQVSSEHASHVASMAAAATCQTLAGASGLDISFNTHGLAVGGLGATTASARIVGSTSTSTAGPTGASRWAPVPDRPAGSANLLGSYETGSQVCNLAWSRTSNELVSTHGYSQNQVVVWRYPSMQQVASLTGHSYRVLYLAMSPDGHTIVTGAGGGYSLVEVDGQWQRRRVGDETLRFWNVFPRGKTSADLLAPESTVSLDRSGAGSNPFVDDTRVVDRWGTIR